MRWTERYRLHGRAVPSAHGQRERQVSDVDQLRQRHPLWAIGTLWTTAASGPDQRRFTASREGVQLHAWEPGELSTLIAAEEMANGWPCKLGGQPVPSL